MARRSKVAAVQQSPKYPYPGSSIFDLFDDPGTITTKSGKTKHVGFHSIKFSPGAVECEYFVNGGKLTRKGIFTVRFTPDDPLGKICASLDAELQRVFREFEKAS